MTPKFGTSGLRGLVTDLTDACVARYVCAFVTSCPTGAGLFVGHDLRSSSPDLAMTVGRAAADAGIDVTMCGPVPTPALALAAMQAGAGAIMVTGSHIPADRNGLKFYTPDGEITKEHEQRISHALSGVVNADASGQLSDQTGVADIYYTSFRNAFRDTLAGRRIGLYQHSAVGRDGLTGLLQDLGADVIVLGRSDVFVPVDTEAVPDPLRLQLKAWAVEHALDAIVSTDADGDRPLLTDQNGDVVPGDILGQITAATLGAQTVVTPVSSNSGVDDLDTIQTVVRTKIGSPFVVAGMQASEGRTVGYEANGGFILGFDAAGPTGPLAPLMTRDALLPILTVLSQSTDNGVAACVASQPARFTAADRLQDIPSLMSSDLISGLQDQKARSAFLTSLNGAFLSVDETDGLRITLTDDRIIHLRASGNAPELRLYVEAGSREDAQETLENGMRILQKTLDKRKIHSDL